MIRYEIALAIIGSIVTVIGIIIAFEIKFLAELYRTDYDETTGAIFSYQESGHKGRITIDFATNGKTYSLKEFCEGRLEQTKKNTAVLALGVITILWLSFQTFFWEIDLKTYQISRDNFLFLFFSLLWSGLWIAFFIDKFHQTSLNIYRTILSEAKKIEEQKTDQA